MNRHRYIEIFEPDFEVVYRFFNTTSCKEMSERIVRMARAWDTDDDFRIGLEALYKANMNIEVLPFGKFESCRECKHIDQNPETFIQCTHCIRRIGDIITDRFEKGVPDKSE